MYEFMRDSIPYVTDVSILGYAQVENIFDMNNRDLFTQNYNIGVTNPGFLKLMGVKLLHGNAGTALDRIDGIIVTQRMAKEIFQRENVVGENLKIKQDNTDFHNNRCGRRSLPANGNYIRRIDVPR